MNPTMTQFPSGPMPPTMNMAPSAAPPVASAPAMPTGQEPMAGLPADVFTPSASVQASPMQQAAPAGMGPDAFGLPGGMPEQAMEVPPGAMGTPGQGPLGAPSGLVEVQNPAGGAPMVLERAPQALPGGGASGGSLFSPMRLLTLALLAGGGVFLYKRLANKAKDVAQNAFEKLHASQDELIGKVKDAIGNPSELETLKVKTLEDVQQAISEHTSAIQGIRENETVAERLVQKTQALFDHAEGLKAADELDDKVVNGFKKAVQRFKAKIIDRVDDEVAQSAEG